MTDLALLKCLREAAAAFLQTADQILNTQKVQDAEQRRKQEQKVIQKPAEVLCVFCGFSTVLWPASGPGWRRCDNGHYFGPREIAEAKQALKEADEPEDGSEETAESPGEGGK